MTIIVMAGNNDFVLQFSDRRLSGASGVVTDQSNKATAFQCLNGRWSVGYTGLAQCGTFRLQEWLVEAFGRCGPPDFGVHEIATRISVELTALFKTHRLIRAQRACNRRLTILLSGYLEGAGNSRIGNLWITNYQDFDANVDHPNALPEFSLHGELQPDDEVGPTSYIQRIGAWHAMSVNDETALRRLLFAGATLDRVIDAGVGLVRRMADRPGAGNSVGKEIAVTIVPKEKSTNVTALVRLAVGRDDMVLVDMATAFPESLGGSVMIRDVKFAAAEPSPTGSTFNPLPSKSAPCWCGSGIKFKRCHGARR